MAKQKNTELNFLYLNDDSKEKKNTKKRNTKAKVKKSKTGADTKSASRKNDTFNFDNEIVIGVTRIPKDEPKQNKKQGNAKKKSSKNINKRGKDTKKTPTTTKRTSNTTKTNIDKKVKKVNKKAVIIKGLIKWTILLLALLASIIMFMMSPLFNLSEVQVINNEKISSDSIISLSELNIGDNIYKTTKRKIENKIKQNAYIESVKIERKLPSKITITVKERKPTYMLEYANSYVYINNQGYILEISEQKLECPIIMGYATSEDNIKPGNRLNEEDLEKLSMVLKIIESANGNEIGHLITRINIEDKQNYTLILENEKKIVYLGDASNLSNRIPHLKVILKEEAGVEGEIFINGDLNKQKVYFRRKE